MAWRRTFYILALALLSPYLYDRYLGLRNLLENRPGRFTSINRFKSHEVVYPQSHPAVRNCEDVLLNEPLGVALISCDPGRDRWNTVMGTFRPGPGMASGKLYLYDYAHEELPENERVRPLVLEAFPHEHDFHPLGLALDAATSTLYAVNHAQTGSVIEVFQLAVDTATATHTQTIQHALLHAPNAIHVLGDGKLYVTNDHFVRAAVSPLLSKLESFSGLAGGTVVFIDTREPQAAKIVARIPFANGLAIMSNHSTIVVASTSDPGVRFFAIQPDHDLRATGRLRTPSAVDNLSIDSAGTLLMAGHPFAPHLVALAKGRADCDPESRDEAPRKACECSSPSWAAEWTEERGLTTLYKSYAFCSSATLVRDVTRGVGMMSGLYEKGILVFRE